MPNRLEDTVPRLKVWISEESDAHVPEIGH